MNHLRDATEKELIDLGDVCSICFQQLDKAKVTGCNHYFHADCLTRWLYLQDTCPNCCSTAAINIAGNNNDSINNNRDSDTLDFQSPTNSNNSNSNQITTTTTTITTITSQTTTTTTTTTSSTCLT